MLTQYLLFLVKWQIRTAQYWMPTLLEILCYTLTWWDIFRKDKLRGWNKLELDNLTAWTRIFKAEGRRTISKYQASFVKRKNGTHFPTFRKWKEDFEEFIVFMPVSTRQLRKYAKQNIKRALGEEDLLWRRLVIEKTNFSNIKSNFQRDLSNRINLTSYWLKQRARTAPTLEILERNLPLSILEKICTFKSRNEKSWYKASSSLRSRWNCLQIIQSRQWSCSREVFEEKFWKFGVPCWILTGKNLHCKLNPCLWS